MSRGDLKNDRPQSFLEIFNQYQERIFNFVFRMTQDRYLSEDLTQEVFLKVYRKEPALKAHPNLSGWIFRIARNLSLNALRNESSKISHENYIRNESQEAGLRINQPDYDLIARETSQSVKNAIGELNGSQREVLILREYHDFTYQEIAEITQSSVSAVKSLLFRARESLRKKLNNQEKIL